MVAFCAEELAKYDVSPHLHFVAVWAHRSTSMLPCAVFARNESSFWMCSMQDDVKYTGLGSMMTCEIL